MLYNNVGHVWMQVTEDKVKTFLEQQDYIAALKELMLPSDRDNLPGNWDTMERDLGSEALGVAALHGHFGHKSATLPAHTHYI